LEIISVIDREGLVGWNMTEKGKVATFIWGIFCALCQGAQLVRISRNHLKIIIPEC